MRCLIFRCVKVWDVRKLKPENNVPVYTFPYTGSLKRTHGKSGHMILSIESNRKDY